mmetsp:Transcript_8883/g.16334  ORF Transcript_8883/g.16334 Transcript_8883/m.16334 type:complete len:253 (-) Transcript_8883:558-1316(-)
MYVVFFLSRRTGPLSVPFQTLLCLRDGFGQALLKRRVAHHLFSDDRGDELCGSHVESEVAHGHALRGDLASSRVDRKPSHLVAAPLLDFNFITRLESQVYCAGGARAVYLHVVLFRDDGQVVGSDLVGNVAVGRNAIRPEHTHVNKALSHEEAGRGVADQMLRNPRLLELPGGQPGALQPRTRFVDVDMDVFLLFLQSVDDTKGSAVVDCGQTARVAVVQQVRRLLRGRPAWDQVCAKLAEPFVDLNVLIAD